MQILSYFNRQTLLACIVLLVVHETHCTGDRLGEYIKNFSPLSYDAIKLNGRHMITKRSVYDKTIDLQLPINNRKLDLLLHPSDDGIIDPDAMISIDGVESKFDDSHLFDGHVKGDPESSVSGSIINGVFQGMIRTGDKAVFYVDRKEYHPSHPLTSHESVHSVIYNKEDVDTERFHELRRAKRSAESTVDGICGRRFDKLAHWMDDLEETGQTEKLGKPTLTRRKRGTPLKNTCNLYLQSDPLLWDHIKATLSTTDETMIALEISALFKDLVREVDGIYQTTDFDGQTGFKFRIDRLAINKTCKTVDDHWFCDTDLDVANYLNLNTYTNHDAYCLAYILTFRDFADGTLGLAWVAKPRDNNPLGGICSKYVKYSETGSTRLKSLNTGIVTVKNYGERVPKLMSQLTLAHEIGHNFGSEHDQVLHASKCTPYKDTEDENGNYIMYYAAISGKRSNNLLFSPCSIGNISKVLQSSGNTACFKENTGSWCGNSLKEGTEVCDCGYDPDCPSCCNCCVGQSNTNDEPDACTLKSLTKTGATVRCDPSQGPCCTSDCGYHLNSVVCKAPTECSLASACDGAGHVCPNATALLDGTVCNSNTQVCVSGECTGSICAKIGTGLWKECSRSSSDEGTTSSSLCTISCEDPITKTCHSSYDTGSLPTDFMAMLTTVNGGEMISLRPGQQCDKGLGFCDYFETCRKVDDLGPLARLKGLLLSLTDLENLTAWMKEYWWVVLLSVTGLVVIMVLLVKFGTVFTPSSNPDKKEARKISKPFTKSERRRRDMPVEAQSAGPTIGGRQGDLEMSQLS